MNIPPYLNAPQVNSFEQNLAKLENSICSNESREKIISLLTAVLNDVSSQGGVWKDLKQWAKQKKISKENLVRSDTEKVATALHNSGILQSAFPSLKQTLESSVKVHSGRLVKKPLSLQTQTNTTPKALEEFDQQFIQQAVAKNHKKILKILGVLISYRSVRVNKHERDFINKVQLRLQVWALQYLVKGAKFEVLEQKGPLHISFVEYYLENISRYYRNDSGEFIIMFLTLLKERCGLNNNDSYVLDMMKPGNFDTICQTACHAQNLKYSTLFSVEQQNLTDSTFYNITDLLQNGFAQEYGDGVNSIVTDLTKLAEISGKNIQFGGTVTIDGQECFILFPRPNIDNLMHQIVAFRGALGAVPEISQIRHQFIAAGFSLVELLKFSPVELNFTQAISPMAVQGTLGQALEILTQVKESIPSKAHSSAALAYYKMFSLLLNGVEERLKNDPQLIDCTQLGPACEAIKNIGKRMNNMSQIEAITQIPNGRKIQEIVQEANLAIEELTLILCFVELEKSSSLLDTVQNIGFQADFKQSYICTSGMSAMRQVLDGLREAYQDSSPQLAFLEGSYYEYTSEKAFGGYLEQFTEYSSGSIDNFMDRAPFDIICLDIYPNYVPLGQVKATPLIEITAKQLENRTPDHPLTLVLDASTTMFWDEKIENLVDTYSGEIQAGLLNIVVVNSLAKFAMCGFDKYTGGVIQTYNKFSAQSSFQAFNQHLSDSTANDLLSPDAEKFFYLFMSNDGLLIKEYLEQINSSTESMYQLLSSLQTPDSLIRLGERDSKIPMLGFSFENILSRFDLKEEIDSAVHLTYMIQYFLAAHALKQDLPISMRISFGFPSINFTECGTALRVTVGLEDQSLIELFANFFKEENKKITHEIESLSTDDQADLKILLKFGDSAIKTWLDSNKAKLVDFAKEHTFVEVLKFVFNEMRQEKLLNQMAQQHKQQTQWFADNKQPLFSFAKNHTPEEFQHFIEDKFLLLPKFIKTHMSSKNSKFTTWIESNIPLLIEVAGEFSFEAMKNFAIKSYCIEDFCHRLKDLYPNPDIFKSDIDEFEGMLRQYATEHTLEELEQFAYKIADLKYLILLMEKESLKPNPIITKEHINQFKTEVFEYALTHSYSELGTYVQQKNYRLNESINRGLPLL